MKLWKVTVNNWTWDAPRTYYAPSRAEAERIAGNFPAADRIQYAGNFNPDTAGALLDRGCTKWP